MTDINMPIDLDNDINYCGNTREERRLNKELLQATLDISSYQDKYDKMLSVDDLRTKIDNIKGLMSEEYLPDGDMREYTGWVEALTWVLNGSETQEEKLAKLPKASRDQVNKIINNLHNRYKQLSLFDEENI